MFSKKKLDRAMDLAKEKKESADEKYGDIYDDVDLEDLLEKDDRKAIYISAFLTFAPIIIILILIIIFL